MLGSVGVLVSWVYSGAQAPQGCTLPEHPSSHCSCCLGTCCVTLLSVITLLFMVLGFSVNVYFNALEWTQAWSILYVCVDCTAPWPNEEFIVKCHLTRICFPCVTLASRCPQWHRFIFPLAGTVEGLHCIYNSVFWWIAESRAC